jgi:acyl-CoA reductase-like NAD-dependent aldehyde dehydrogenase
MTSLQVKNPSTGQLFAELPCDNETTIRIKFDAAQKLQKLWRKEPLRKRLDAASRFCGLLLKERDKLARDLTFETGKPITQARSEIESVTKRVDFFMERAPTVLATQTVSGPESKVTELVEQEALGVALNISAWNYPYFVGINVLMPALLCGNAVLYKPSEYAAVTGTNIVRLLVEAGFPSELISAVIGGPAAGESLLSLPFDGVFFTGSYKTGKHILKTVGSRMIRLQLELGGKDGIYVCEDAPIDTAVPSIADGAFYNTGQGCCSVERIYVHDSIYDAFKTKLVAEIKSFKMGDPMLEDTYIGPLTRPQHLGFLQDQVKDAALHGCKILCGGEMQTPYFTPTVVECTDDQARVLSEESFGPIVTIQRVTGDEEAIQKLNNSTYGLTAGVYSKDKERAIRVLSEVQTGSSYWNCCDRVSPYLPWTGRKASGIGATLGDEGIRVFTHPKAWHLRSLAS